MANPQRQAAIQQLQNLARIQPDASASALISQLRDQGFSLRRQDALEIVRQTRGVEKRADAERFTPRKYLTAPVFGRVPGQNRVQEVARAAPNSRQRGPQAPARSRKILFAEHTSVVFDIPEDIQEYVPEFPNWPPAMNYISRLAGQTPVMISIHGMRKVTSRQQGQQQAGSVVWSTILGGKRNANTIPDIWDGLEEFEWIDQVDVKFWIT